MPWPATHILIAEKFYKQHFSHLDRQAFIIGTCFPDIRYPAKIKRQHTHLSDPPLSAIKTSTPFQAGMLFHSKVDTSWNHYIRAHKERLFSVIPHDRPMFHTMKILQDKYLYAKHEGWHEITVFFNTTLPEELEFGVSKALVKRWHGFLAHYLGKPPRIDDLQMLELSLPFDLVGDIRYYYQKYQENATLTRIMTGFYDQFETLSQRF